MCLVKPEAHAIKVKDWPTAGFQVYHFQYNCDDEMGYFDSVREAIDSAIANQKEGER